MTWKGTTENEQLYEAYQAGEVVIFPHLDCLIRYIDELEKFHAEYEGGSFSSDLEMESKLRELYWEKPTNQFTALARKGYKIPGTSGTHSTLFSTADPSLAWKYEQLKFTDAVESWTLNSGSLGDSEIFDVLKVMFYFHVCLNLHLTVAVPSDNRRPISSNQLA